MHTGGKGLQRCAEGPERSARDLIGDQWSMLFKESAAGCETTCRGMVAVATLRFSAPHVSQAGKPRP